MLSMFSISHIFSSVWLFSFLPLAFSCRVQSQNVSLGFALLLVGFDLNTIVNSTLLSLCLTRCSPVLHINFIRLYYWTLNELELYPVSILLKTFDVNLCMYVSYFTSWWIYVYLLWISVWKVHDFLIWIPLKLHKRMKLRGRGRRHYIRRQQVLRAFWLKVDIAEQVDEEQSMIKYVSCRLSLFAFTSAGCDPGNRTKLFQILHIKNFQSRDSKL